MTQIGDKWVSDCGTVTLFCGDCLSLLPTLPKVDAVVTDPPYGVGLKAKRAKQRDGKVVARRGSYSCDDSPEYVSAVVVPAIETCRKVATSVAVTPGTRCAWLYPQPDDVGYFFSAAGTGMGRWGFTCSQPILYYGSDPFLRNGMGARPNSCGQTYPNDANDIDHPCAKPIRMWQWLVERASLDSETILDPFMGSGTTGVACVRTGRRFIGIELSPAYFNIAVRRIKAELDARKNALFDPVEYRVTQKSMFDEAST